MAASSSKERGVRRIGSDEQARADGSVGPYDSALIFRSTFKMEGHLQMWPSIDLDELKTVNPNYVGQYHRPPGIASDLQVFWERKWNPLIDISIAP